ncbi:MAG: hypothetical protein QNJ17_11280 [Desulfocapsaceae bacterium]|nr:hypothetical protein [Desulfocapsaceae bacterium]
MNQPDIKQPEVKHHDDWTFFDKIYCISIDQRRDRREQVKKQFAEVGMLERVEFAIVDKHPTNPEQGIFESHMACLQKGLARGGRHILVFEDDVFFQTYNSSVLRGVCDYLDTGVKWNGLFLGCMVDGSTRTAEKNLMKITYRTLAHAYALNRPFAEKLVQNSWKGIPFDEFLRLNQEEFYAIYPMCAFQGLSGTDNQRIAIDRVRRLFGGLPFIQKMNELYHNHPLPLLGATAGITVVSMLLLALLILKV